MVLPLSTTKPKASPGQPPSNFNYDLATLGLWTSIAGAALGSIGSYYSVKSMQNVTKQQAADLTFRSQMSDINARAAEFDASEAIAAGRKQAGMVAQRYGQAKGAARAAIGGRGIKLGVGSAAETTASIELAKQADVFTVNSNAVRQAMASRTQAQNIRTQGALDAISAQNLRGTANTMSPELAGLGTLLTSGSGIAAQWLEVNRYSNRYGFGAGRSQ